MSTFWLILLSVFSGAGAGLLARLIGIGGGIVVVPVVFYGLIDAGTPADQAAHIAVGTSSPRAQRRVGAAGSLLTLRWRKQDSNRRYRVTRPGFREGLISPLLDSLATQNWRECKPAPRRRRTPPAAGCELLHVRSAARGCARGRRRDACSRRSLPAKPDAACQRRPNWVIPSPWTAPAVLTRKTPCLSL
jgi:hypothetical protein